MFNFFYDYSCIYYFLVLLCIIYTFAGVGRAVYFKRDEVRVFLFGILFIVLAAINDIFYYMHIISTIQIGHYGMFGFVLFQDAVLSVRFSKTFLENEQLNTHLEDLVEKRTAQLSETMSELQIVNNKNKKDLIVAQNIQIKLIPETFPEVGFLKMYASYIPMEELEGDLYDVYYINEYTIGSIILDVCGHGVPAALITTMAKILFTNSVRLFSTTDKVLEYVNKELAETIQGSGDYLTAFFSIIDIRTKKMYYTNAGHTDVYVLRTDGSLHHLPVNSPVVGVIKDLEFKQETFDIHEKDRIIYYTDGIIEVRNIKNELYGTDRLEKKIIDYMHDNGDVFIDKLFHDIISFRDSSPVTDDCAVLFCDIAK